MMYHVSCSIIALTWDKVIMIGRVCIVRYPITAIRYLSISFEREIKKLRLMHLLIQGKRVSLQVTYRIIFLYFIFHLAKWTPDPDPNCWLF